MPPNDRPRRRSEARDTDLGVAIRKALRWWLMDYYTALPGVVVSYDGTKRRAVIQPGLRLLNVDGSSESRPPLHDVPVVQPWGNGHGVHLPLARGDCVMLLFSMRDIGSFKDNLAESDAAPGRMMSMGDAVAFPGWGPSEITPAADSGVIVQSNDGATYARIDSEAGIVELKQGDHSVRVESAGITVDGPLTVTGSVTIEGASVDHDGTEIGKTHDHKVLKSKISTIARPQTTPTPTETTTETVEDSD